MFAYDELSNMYDKLSKEMAKLEKKNNSMKEMMLSMNVELDGFKNEYVKLKESHDKLDEDNDFLRYENEKLCKGHKELSLKVAKVRQEMKNDECNDKCIKELEELWVESENLKSSLEDASKTIAKFVEGKKKLNMLLNQ